MSRIHRYAGEKVSVEFDLSRCIHIGDCTSGLSTVFDSVRSGRWVHPDAAPAADVARICAECPTGALRCIDRASGKPMDAPPAQNTVQTAADGPLYVHGRMSVNGKPAAGFRAAFCRCGASRLMPYCDNSHREAGFRDTGKVLIPLPSDAGENSALNIRSTAGGPLTIEGPFTLLDGEGGAVCESAKAAFCRCGAAKMKPYCDGSHNRIDFEAT